MCTVYFYVYLNNFAFFTDQQREPFKKRWFILDALERKLLYFKTELVSQDQLYSNNELNHNYLYFFKLKSN